MIHFAGEIILLSLVLALLWFCIGWWWCNLDRAKSHHAREAEWAHRLNRLRRDRDAFRDEVEKAHGAIRVLEHRRADGKSPPKEAELTVEERAQYEKAIRNLQETQEITQRKMLGFSQRVESLHQQNLEREDILQKLKEKLDDSATALKQRDTMIDQLGSSSAAQKNNGLSDVRALQQKLADRDRKIEQLRASLNQQQTSHPKQDERSPTQRKLEFTIDEQDRELQQNRLQLEQLRKNLAATTHTLQKREARLQELANGASGETVDWQAKQASLQNVIIEQQKNINALKTEQEKHLQLHERNLKLEHTVADQSQKIILLHKQVKQAPQESVFVGQSKPDPDAKQIAILTSQLVSMREAMTAQESVITELRQALAKSSKIQGAATRRDLRKPPKQSADIPRSGDLFDTADSVINQPNARPQSSPGSLIAAASFQAPSIRLFTSAPDNVDDLKKINGVGPAFERTLNSLGIYRFEQIAGLSSADITWVAREIHSFPERIIKGRWVEQAKALNQ